MSEPDAIAGARRALTALYLEAPTVVAQDVQRRVEAALDDLATRLRELEVAAGAAVAYCVNDVPCCASIYRALSATPQHDPDCPIGTLAALLPDAKGGG